MRGARGWDPPLWGAGDAPGRGAHGGSAPRGADGIAVFARSDQKDVALEIQVTNAPSDPAQPQRDGDDAHEALLTATFPPELPYSALRPVDGRAPSVRGARGVPRVLGQGDGVVLGDRNGPGAAGGGGMGTVLGMQRERVVLGTRGGQGWSWGCRMESHLGC